MSLNFSWFTTGLQREQALTALQRVAPRAAHRVSLAHTPRGTAVQVLDDEAALWAQAVSHATATLTVSVVVFEDVWSLDVFEAGRHTMLFDNSWELGSLLGGDVAGATARLGAKPKLFERHQRLWERSFEGEGDEADPWGHAEALESCPSVCGYPEGGFPPPFTLQGEAAGWPRLPERLPLSVCAPEKVPSRLRFKTMDGQREALLWAETWLGIAPRLAHEVAMKVELARPTDRGVVVRAAWMRIITNLALGDPTALVPAEALLVEWLQPSTMGNANQYLSVAQMQRVAQTAKRTEWLELISARGEPDLAFDDGDSF